MVYPSLPRAMIFNLVFQVLRANDLQKHIIVPLTAADASCPGLSNFLLRVYEIGVRKILQLFLWKSAFRGY